MHDLSKISTIQKIEPIKDRDRIVLATVENYNVIIKKDEFEVGDRVIYLFYDTLLPIKPEYEFLRKNSYNARFDGFRIKPMKMAGVISEGLVLPLSVLPEDKRNLPVGTVLDEILELRNYQTLVEESEAPAAIEKLEDKPWWFKLPLTKKLQKRYLRKQKIKYAYPCPKSDEENIEKIWDEVKDSEETFYRSVKMEGCASTYYYNKGELFSFSRNTYNNTGNFAKVAQTYNFKEALKDVNKIFGDVIIIQGEICGAGIQKNIYKFTEPKFFLYGGYYKSTQKPLNEGELDWISQTYEIPRVPELPPSKILGSLEEMLEDCIISPSEVNKEVKFDEGIVWANLSRTVHFKCKSRPYKVWFESV